MRQWCSRDSQAILILCSDLCVGEGISPLKPSEWKWLAKTLRKKKLTPSAILEMSQVEIINELNYDEVEAERFLRLLGRSASLFFEISKYEGMGINLMTRADKIYPPRLKQKLGDACPPFFYYAGDTSLLRKRGVGFVGSRNLTQKDTEFEYNLVEKVVRKHYAIISGGAKGADTVSEDAALASGGRMIEFLPGAMLAKLLQSATIKAVQNNELLLLSTVRPEQSFTVANAMNRNKYIYAQADAAVVIKSINQGGTWSGANDALKHQYCPVFCWNNPEYSDNLELIKNGALPLDENWEVSEIAKAKTSPAETTPATRQAGLFDDSED